MLRKVTGHILANTRPHQLGWPGDGDCYLLHRMQSDGGPYPEGQ